MLIRCGREEQLLSAEHVRGGLGGHLLHVLIVIASYMLSAGGGVLGCLCTRERSARGVGMSSVVDWSGFCVVRARTFGILVRVDGVYATAA